MTLDNGATLTDLMIMLTPTKYLRDFFMRTSNATPHQSPPLLYQCVILIFISFYLMRWFFPMTAIEWTINIAGLAAFLVCYFAAFNLQKWTLPSAFVMVALAVGIAPYNNGASTFAIYACSFFAYFFPARVALPLYAVTLGVLAAATFFFQLDVIFYFVVGAVSCSAITVFGIFDRQRLLYQGREMRSQEEIQRLAKIAERERIGQDLHDTLGHRLTAIHLKAQLALKLLEDNQQLEGNQQLESSQRSAVRDHLAQVQQLAQDALREIRETIADIKTHGLTAELDAQKELLESLGISFQYTLPSVLLPPTMESDLLLIVREALTNVLRHSGASRCELHCRTNADILELTIWDNGCGFANSHTDLNAHAGLNNHASLNVHEGLFGNGLQSIYQRVTLRRGTLSLNPPDSTWPGLTLSIHLPWNPPPVS